MGLTLRQIGRGYSSPPCLEHVKKRRSIMIVERSRCRNIPKTALTLWDFKSYDWKHFQAVSLTSTTIKERDKVAILFILGKHEVRPEMGKPSHDTTFRSRSPASPPGPADQIQRCRRTSESPPTLAANCFLTCVFLQETTGHCCRVEADGGRYPDGNFDRPHHRTPSHRRCSDAKTPTA